MDDLQEVVVGVLEDHEDAFAFQDYFYEMDEAWVGELGAEGHFADGGLGDAGVLEFAFFVGFELFDREGLGS